MIKNKQTRRTIAIFFLLNFLSTMVPYNLLYAQNSSPNTPEAGAFEPVDATDMVDLLTGDLSYVLPLLNIPSPEGGYPLALSYHAGIAMDQEASWVGLGWNINPGAINRNVNGYPDDYDKEMFTEYFWDKEQTVTEYHASVGYSWGSGSIGLGAAWGSHRSVGGFVSIGVGMFNGRVGSDGGSFGVGAQVGALTFGVSTNLEGKVDYSYGVDTNGVGFSISSSGTFTVSVTKGKKSTGKMTSVDVSFSSSGVGIDVKSATYKSTKESNGTMTYSKVKSGGVGLNYSSFSNTSNIGDYVTSSKGFTIPIIIPIYGGFLGITFGKQEFKFYLNKTEYNQLSGPLNYYKLGEYKWRAHCPPIIVNHSMIFSGWTKIVDTKEEAEELCNSCANNCEVNQVIDPTVLDIFELPVDVVSQDVLLKENVTHANPNFPNYDKYSVQAQGLSGAISPRIFESGALYSFSGKKDSDGQTLDYVLNAYGGIPEKYRFLNKPEFYFENEISSYIKVSKPDLDLGAFNNTASVLNNSIALSRRKTSSFVKYYTNKEILTNETSLLSEGFIETISDGFDRGMLNQSGIGAFKITSVDGKTYHYSLPVYNHEIINRTYGMAKYYQSDNVRPENEAYFEKNLTGSYATHWLLTSITGPDYVDVNNDGKLNKGDYGYWVEFDYGKYTDGFIWANPYGKEVFEKQDNKNIKSWTRGRKELYYLDRVKTRTHTAIFVKSKRKDGKSKRFKYGYAVSKDSYEENGFEIPSQYPIKLDKILLVKGDDLIDKSSGNELESKIDLFYKNGGYKRVTTTINQMNNIIDIEDDIVSIKDKVIKSIEFDNEHYDLAKGTPNSDIGGRLTLKGVYFKGKKETSVLPPYRFNYINPNYNFNIDDKDEFGYYKEDNSIWSLNEIVTPQGGKIKIDYEPHVIKPVLVSEFNVHSDFFFTVSKVSENRFKITSNEDMDFAANNIGFKVGDKVSVENILWETPHQMVGRIKTCTKKTETILETILGPKEIIVYSDKELLCTPIFEGSSKVSVIHLYYKVINPVRLGGSRVKRISTINDDGKYYNMNYTYGENEDGVGYVTYLPYAPELARELPYSSELPPPIPMYEFVSTTTGTGSSSIENNVYGIKTDYQFNVLKSKEEGKAKFGNFYELTSEQTYGTKESDTQLHDFIVKDNLGAIGQLLSVKSYNLQGQILNSIENRYYSPDETPNKLGVTQESYQTYKKIIDYSNNERKIGVSSTRITYPNLLKNSTEIKRGNSYTSQFNDLDEITGQAREVFSYSSTGQKFLRRSEQAYRKYSAMGSKVDNVSNKNMLSQVAADYNYLFKNGEWKPVGADITTWNNDWTYRFNDNSVNSVGNVWRKHQNYIWKGAKNEDGTLIGFSEDDFNWIIGSNQNSNWELTSEVTRYDQFSQALEVKDINHNYMSNKMGDNYSKVIAITNANYDDMYYSGAEYVDGAYFDGGIKATGYEVSNDAHTGTGIVKVAANVPAFEVTVPARADRTSALHQRFKVSVWVKRLESGATPALKINVGGTQVDFEEGEDVIAGNWVKKQGYITIPSAGTTVSIKSVSAEVQLDDFRLHPATSSMTSYVYNEWDEVSYITGANGLSTHYIYDAAGRLIETQVEVVSNPDAGIGGGFTKVSTNSYNYKNNQ